MFGCLGTSLPSASSFLKHTASKCEPLIPQYVHSRFFFSRVQFRASCGGSVLSPHRKQPNMEGLNPSGRNRLCLVPPPPAVPPPAPPPAWRDVAGVVTLCSCGFGFPTASSITLREATFSSSLRSS